MIKLIALLLTILTGIGFYAAGLKMLWPIGGMLVGFIFAFLILHVVGRSKGDEAPKHPDVAIANVGGLLLLLFGLIAINLIVYGGWVLYLIQMNWH